jgi:hypothetical protein
LNEAVGSYEEGSEGGTGIASLEATSIPYLPDELVALLDQLKQQGFDISAHPELRISHVLVEITE